MASQETLHIRPVGGGSWAVKVAGSATTSSVYPSESEAAAGAYELASGRDEAEVIVHEPDGGIRSTLTIRRHSLSFDRLDTQLILGEAEDAALRAEVTRITPSDDRLRRMIGKFNPPPGSFDDEEMA